MPGAGDGNGEVARSNRLQRINDDFVAWQEALANRQKLLSDIDGMLEAIPTSSLLVDAADPIKQIAGNEGKTKASGDAWLSISRPTIAIAGDDLDNLLEQYPVPKHTRDSPQENHPSRPLQVSTPPLQARPVPSSEIKPARTSSRPSLAPPSAIKQTRTSSRPERQVAIRNVSPPVSPPKSPAFGCGHPTGIEVQKQSCCANAVCPLCHSVLQRSSSTPALPSARGEHHPCMYRIPSTHSSRSGTPKNATPEVWVLRPPNVINGQRLHSPQPLLTAPLLEDCSQWISPPQVSPWRGWPQRSTVHATTPTSFPGVLPRRPATPSRTTVPVMVLRPFPDVTATPRAGSHSQSPVRVPRVQSRAATPPGASLYAASPSFNLELSQPISLPQVGHIPCALVSPQPHPQHGAAVAMAMNSTPRAQAVWPTPRTQSLQQPSLLQQSHSHEVLATTSCRSFVCILPEPALDGSQKPCQSGREQAKEVQDHALKDVNVDRQDPCSGTEGTLTDEESLTQGPHDEQGHVQLCWGCKGKRRRDRRPG